MILPAEVWAPITDFPKYEVSNYGRVANIGTDQLVEPSYTQQGALKVGIYGEDSRQHTRSLKVLVAHAFVSLDVENEVIRGSFDTPIQLDGNPENCMAINLRWRPRWFAWHYSRQFTKQEVPTQREVFNAGPIVELDIHGHVHGLWDSPRHAAVANGLLWHSVWTSMNTGQACFPTNQVFAFDKKV